MNIGYCNNFITPQCQTQQTCCTPAPCCCPEPQCPVNTCCCEPQYDSCCCNTQPDCCCDPHTFFQPIINQHYHVEAPRQRCPRPLMRPMILPHRGGLSSNGMLPTGPLYAGNSPFSTRPQYNMPMANQYINGQNINNNPFNSPSFNNQSQIRPKRNGFSSFLSRSGLNLNGVLPKVLIGGGLAFGASKLVQHIQNKQAESATA